MAAIAPAPASLACRKCRTRLFYVQLTESGSYLACVCANCSEPVLFRCELLPDFSNRKPYVIEAAGKSGGA
jgi:hypothetical protein